MPRFIAVMVMAIFMVAFGVSVSLAQDCPAVDDYLDSSGSGTFPGGYEGDVLAVFQNRLLTQLNYQSQGLSLLIDHLGLALYGLMA